MKLDDSILTKELFSPTCSRCRHLSVDVLAGGVSCAAFPVAIPPEIWSGGNPHTSPYPGDKGILFSPIEEE